MTSGNGNDNEDDSRCDLTRIEDLSEFLHEEDAEVEDLFGGFNKEVKSDGGTQTDVTKGLSLNDLDDSSPDELPLELPETPDDTVSEMDFGGGDQELQDNSPTFENEESSDSDMDALDDAPFTLSENSFDAPADEAPFEEAFESAADDTEDTEDPFSSKNDRVEPMIPLEHERFEEVKNFAQNFSYGQIQGGGNPPFSIIIRNLKYESDAEDIMTLLREFGLVTDVNLAETEKALQLGSLLIPQISEYSAITLAHKFRRYDCDLEVGLSDEVHPSKSGEKNPRGLMKKDSLKQNISESYNASAEITPAKEILVSTTGTIEGKRILKYIGVQTSFAIVDEEELERLKFVQKAARVGTVLEHYETEETLSSERAFKDYQNSFELLFIDLCDQLKMKAMKEKANALIGLNYQLTSMPFEKSANGGHCYQLICSATLTIVGAESK